MSAFAFMHVLLRRCLGLQQAIVRELAHDFARAPFFKQQKYLLNKSRHEIVK